MPAWVVTRDGQVIEYGANETRAMWISRDRSQGLHLIWVPRRECTCSKQAIKSNGPAHTHGHEESVAWVDAESILSIGFGQAKLTGIGSADKAQLGMLLKWLQARQAKGTLPRKIRLDALERALRTQP